MDDLACDVAVIGAGPAGLMAAETAARGVARVTVFDAMPSAARKFLMAGRGGLNLTHSESLPPFLAHYGAAEAALTPAIAAFAPQALRDWSAALGQDTFVGSSGRVFPAAMKASPLLRAWLRRLQENGVTLQTRHRWTGWDGDALTFATPGGNVRVAARATVLALGGASWPKLGSDGAWATLLAERGIAIAPFRPSNCGFTVAWSDVMKARGAGRPLKNIALSFDGRRLRGEAMLTQHGIEGGAVYALSPALRDAIARDGFAELRIALRPDLDAAQMAAKMAPPRGKASLGNFLRKSLGLTPAALALLHEAALAQGAALATLSPDALAALVNAVPLRLSGTGGLDRAISSVGGIALQEIDERFMLRKLPGVFAAGEMLDWDAPTGGYLLQASFATGMRAGRGAARFLDHADGTP